MRPRSMMANRQGQRVAWRKVTSGRTGRNTLFGSAWQVLRLAIQLATVTILARTLGPYAYGTFAGYTGLGIVLAGLTSLGTGTLLIRNVARDASSFGRHWYAMLKLSLVVTIMLLVAYVVIAPRALNAPLPTSGIICLGLAELLFYPLVYCASFAFQAFERIGWATAIATSTAGFRLLGALAFAVQPSHWGIQAYCFIYLFASAMGGVFAICAAAVVLKPPAARRGWIFHRHEIKTGLVYCMPVFTANGMVELDKILAVRFSGPANSAVYTIAYRAMSALATPVSILAIAVQPKLFRVTGREHAAQRRRLVALILASTVALGILGGFAMVLGGYALPWLLGPAFAELKSAMALLSPLPVLYCLRMIMGTILTTEGGQRARALLEGIALLVMVLLASLAMPGHGLGGIAVTIIGTEFLLLCGLSVAVAARWKHSRPSGLPASYTEDTGQP